MTTYTARTTYRARPIEATALEELRERDDAGRPFQPFVDPEGEAPLRCCLRDSGPGERIALVSYAPLRRWAAATGADPGAYDEQGPVFIHADECGGPAQDGHPFADAGRPRTVRRYSAEGRILGGRLLHLPEAAEAALDAAFAEAFEDSEVALVHVRAVEYGCFLFEVRRP